MTGYFSSDVKRIMDSHASEVADLPDRWSLTIEQARIQTKILSERWNRNSPKMEEVVSDRVIGRAGHPIEVRSYLPAGKGNSVILYLHGGGWAVGDIDTHDSTTRQLALEMNTTVVSCNYRLAPEHPFPAGLEDCVDVYNAIANGRVARVATPESLAVAGDSAGANLAFGVLQNTVQQREFLRPAFGILFYGVYGLDFGTTSYKTFADGPTITRTDMQRFWNWYLGDYRGQNDPLAIPLATSDEVLGQLPPLFLGAAKIDPLFSENEQLKLRLESLGRNDVWCAYPGVPHGFIQMNQELDLARKALADAGKAYKDAVRKNTHIDKPAPTQD